jgi:hypothetical protein
LLLRYEHEHRVIGVGCRAIHQAEPSSPGRLDVLGVLRTICTVVGAVVLYCAVIAALWYALIRAGRRRGRVHAERRATARAMPVAPGAAPVEPAGPAGSWADLQSTLSRDRPWAVAVVLLGSPAVRHRTAPFVDVANRSVDWTGLLDQARAWPPDQRLLVQRAYELSARMPRGRLEPEDGITTLS